MYCGDDVSSVVLDIGQYQLRAGYSGEDCPKSVIPSSVGIIQEQTDLQNVQMRDEQIIQENENIRKLNMIVGDTELSHYRENMEIQSVYNRDGFYNFDIFDELINRSLLQTLQVNLQDTPILFTESAIHNKEFRMKLTEYMFEKYKIPALFIVKDPVLCSFSCGRSSSLIVDCGHKSTICTPVNDGYALLKSITKFDIGGEMLTKDLLNFITNKKKIEVRPRFTFKKKFLNIDGNEQMQIFDLTQNDALKNCTQSYYEYSQMELAREIKEDFLSVSDDILQIKSVESNRIGSYELPDGSKLQMTSFERQNIPEKLFQNQSSLSLSKEDYERQNISEQIQGFSGVHHMAVESISKSDVDIRRELFLNIILSGGTSMIKGFNERVQKQILDVSPQNVKVKVLSSNDRRFQSWVGGSILSSLGSFQQMWMSRYEYEEHGSMMIERKCP